MSSWIGGWGIVTGWLKVRGDLTAEKELKGSRLLLGASLDGSLSAGAYMFVHNTFFDATRGYVLPRAGSIVGISLITDCTAGGGGTSVRIEIRINDVNVYQLSIDLTSGVGIYSAYDTQARRTDTFNAGDLLQFYMVAVGSTCRRNIGMVELQFDT